MVFDEVFPTQKLSLRTERLLLRPPDLWDPECLDVYRRISGRLLQDEHWFESNWYLAEPPEIQISAARNYLQQLVDWTPDAWSLKLMVWSDREVIGEISLRGVRFLQTRSLSTGSWLAPEWRGRGLGKEMRAAVLFFGFRMLGAEEFRSEAHRDNRASGQTSLSLGYREDGTTSKHAPDDYVRYLLIRDMWRDDQEVRVSGFEECRHSFGI